MNVPPLAPPAGLFPPTVKGVREGTVFSSYSSEDIPLDDWTRSGGLIGWFDRVDYCYWVC